MFWQLWKLWWNNIRGSMLKVRDNLFTLTLQHLWSDRLMEKDQRITHWFIHLFLDNHFWEFISHYKMKANENFYIEPISKLVIPAFRGCFGGWLLHRWIPQQEQGKTWGCPGKGKKSKGVGTDKVGMGISPNALSSFSSGHLWLFLLSLLRLSTLHFSKIYKLTLSVFGVFPKRGVVLITYNNKLCCRFTQK